MNGDGLPELIAKMNFREIGHAKEWVQMNHSFTAKKGTVRGMHFQLPPYQGNKNGSLHSG